MLPANQDDYLDAGYFRSGHTIRQTRFLFVEGRMWSTVWSRVPLQTYELSKRQRKLWSRCTRKFRFEVGPYERSEDQDRVYHQYQSSHPLDVGQTIDEIFGLHEPTHEFNTFCIRIFDEARLVGFSCFDLGDRTLASLFGCYLPAYSNYSLGIFSMLIEMAFGRALGLEHYHPGYCVPGLAPFAYKQRLPNLEGLHFMAPEWMDFATLLVTPLPHEMIVLATEKLQQALNLKTVKSTWRYMPLYELSPLDNDQYGPIPLPIALELPKVFQVGEYYVGYDLNSQKYQIWFGVEIANLAFEPDFSTLHNQVPVASNLKFYEWRKLLVETSDINVITSACTRDAIILSTMRSIPLFVLGYSDDQEEN